MASRPVQLGSVLAIVGAITLSACSQASPVAPAPVSAVPAVAAAYAEGPVLATGAAAPLRALESVKGRDTSDMRSGTFTLTFAAGTLTGDYSGAVVVRGSNQPRGNLQLVVTGGSGAFIGAEGNLTGAAEGTLLGEGPFDLSLRGTVSTNSSEKVDVRGSLQGTSGISCGGTGLIHITMTGTGTARDLGPVGALMHHDLSNTGCN